MGTKQSGQSAEERAGEWLNEQEAQPRPGTIPTTDTSALDAIMPEGVRLSPVIEWVSPNELRPNPRNDFEPLPPEEYAHLREDIARNGVLDALTARRDGTIITGENRWRIANELLASSSERVRKIPVRYYVGELSPEQEYDILEGDNLFRRHLTPQQKKERVKARIRRHFGEELGGDRRGGDRKSVRSGSKIQGESLIDPAPNLAEKVAHKLHIPKGTAQRYVAEIRKEKRAAPEKGSRRGRPGELTLKERKKGEKLAARLRTLRGVTALLEEKLARAKAEEKKVLRELRSIGNLDLFGVKM